MARLIENVVGHVQSIDQLHSLIESKRWPHAMLFVGPSGIGKKKLALAFAQMLICKESSEACGVCGPCLRIEKQQSESLIFIQPDPEMARKAIKVDEVREVMHSLSLSSIGSSRVVIIDQAETMNDQASNALLKTLEEPFENVYFILIGEDIHSFLPTIRSRTQVMRFSTLSENDLKKIKPQRPSWSYLSSRGRVDQLELLTSKEGLEKREEALLYFEQFCDDPLFLLAPDWKIAFKDRAQAQFNIKCWMQIVRDLLVLKTQAQQFVLNTDQVARLKKLYQIQTKKLHRLAEVLLQSEMALKGNAEPLLVFENLWVKYARMD
jgi:DNA polymerase-3 subunit delta'